MFDPGADMVRALGIDPGVSRCGYGVVARYGRGRSLTLKADAAGVIRTHPKDPLPERLASIATEIDALIVEYAPAVVVVERVLFQVNVRTAMATGQASGLALAGAARAGIPVAHYSPNEVKLAVAGHGAADKGEVQKMVQAQLRLETAPNPPDAADALALALCYFARADVAHAIATGDPGTTDRFAAAVARAEARSPQRRTPRTEVVS
ncbi:MAG: crossover junction endodeoxyribonuclease RuvC [Acidimicrobiia bacterium]